MSIIATFITKYGLVVASDSNLTQDTGNAGFGQKIFPIPHLNACVAYSGSYSIHNKDVDIVIVDFINGSYFIQKTIAEFTSEFCKYLNSEMVKYELEIPTIIHVTGYPTNDNLSSIQHWHISNTGLKEDGSYEKSKEVFLFHKDFDSFENQEQKSLLSEFEKDPFHYFMYINGYPPGRISIRIVMNSLMSAMKEIINNTEWNFRNPKKLFELSNLIKMSFHVVIEMFKMSNHNALYVGGEIQTFLLPNPQNLDTELFS